MVSYPSESMKAEDRHTLKAGNIIAIKRWTWSATTLGYTVAFKLCLVDTKGSKVCQKNIRPVTIGTILL